MSAEKEMIAAISEALVNNYSGDWELHPETRDWFESILKQANQPKEVECNYHADKNWTDDYSEALGNKYSRVCRSCNSKFFGHKGRYACRECGEKPQQQSVETGKCNCGKGYPITICSKCRRVKNTLNQDKTEKP